MIFGTGTRATYTMSLPSSCDIELDSPVCATSASRCGRASSQIPSAATYVVPSSSTLVVSEYRPSFDRTYPSCSSVISRRRAVGRGNDGAAGDVTDREHGRRRAEGRDDGEAAGQRFDEVRARLPRHRRILARPTAMSQDQPIEPRRGPLDGIVVADLSRILAGPYCSMLLADMGATVIKVEGPSGDDTRTWMPPVKDGVSTYYLSIGRNKRSVVLDFRDPDDRALAAELLQPGRRRGRELQAGLAGEVRARLRVRRCPATPGSSTSRSAGSAPPRAPGCPVTT